LFDTLYRSQTQRQSGIREGSSLGRRGEKGNNHLTPVPGGKESEQKMGLGKLPYSRLEPLIRRHLTSDEDDATAALIRRMRAARKRGYVTASELEAVCYWKSARVIARVRSNGPARVRSATRAALAARRERERLESLLTLNGVGVPMASALLMLLDPKRYGVIDIRAWQLLHATGVVTVNARGMGFTTVNWLEYLTIVRRLAKKFHVGARDIGRALFDIHAKYQEGLLYG